jgi:transcription-repair coupling factor (superfamily II helicase)
MRALFRCVANGRQAVLLAPTGVLAAQHYKTIVSRMGPDTPFKVNVGLLRGGMSPKVGRDLRLKIQTGEIQLIVGTHALLSKGVPYNNIGLLVIDEEQRFGVKQKERLKIISSGVDVLTLTATPIPRTLQMSLSGIRDTSSIRSPPPLRKSIVSVVECFSESLVYEAISRELERGGQCFYVVPRISMIETAKETIESIFPDIRIAIAHGRMGVGKVLLCFILFFLHYLASLLSTFKKKYVYITSFSFFRNGRS